MPKTTTDKAHAYEALVSALQQYVANVHHGSLIPSPEDRRETMRDVVAARALLAELGEAFTGRLEEDEPVSRCCRHSYCTEYTTDPSGLCPGHRDLEPAPLHCEQCGVIYPANAAHVCRTRKPHPEDFDGTEDLNDARAVKPHLFEP